MLKKVIPDFLMLIWLLPSFSRSFTLPVSVTCEIRLNGIVKSMIETKYYGWQAGDIKTNISL